MSVKTQSDLEAELEPVLERLMQLADAGHKMLDFAAALYNHGHHEAAAHVELAALKLSNSDVTHRWRQLQARRAPANQFLLLRNNLRTKAFQKALSEQVSGDDLVLEIGTGSGILAMLAAKAGAAHIVTCEHQSLMARVAQDIIRDNGMQDKITVLSKPAHELELGTDLPRRANLLMADLFTGSLLEAGGLKLIQRAQEKLLRKDGHIIPAAGTLRGRLVGGSALEKLCRSGRAVNLDLSRFNLFSPPMMHLSPERFATLEYRSYSEPVNCFRFDFNNLQDLQEVKRETEIECTDSGNVTGFLQWLRLELSPSSIMESDEQSHLGWTRYLHVFPEPISVISGQRLELRLQHDWTSFSVWPS